jgi:hypothetical protein
VARIPEVPKGSLDAFYRVSELLRREALAEARSILTGDQVWNRENAQELRQRIFDNPDPGDEKFDAKLQAQVSTASDEVRLLAAELRLLHVLPIFDLAQKKKLARVDALLPEGVEIPPEVVEGLRTGVSKWGTGHPQVRHQYRLLLDLVIALSELSPDERKATVDDPWRFKVLLFGVDPAAAFMEREALLFVVHPDSFDAVFNGAHKDAIVDTFREHASGVEDRDRAILRIREALTPEFGEAFNWYRDDIAARWRPRKSVPPNGGRQEVALDIPPTETERRRLRVARWIHHLTAVYRAEGREDELEPPGEEVAARISGLRDALLAGADPDRAYLDALGDAGVTSPLRRGSQRVFVAGFFREGGAEAVEALAETLLPPADLTEAEASLRRVHELADRVGTPRAPTPSVASLLLPSLWSLQAPDRYAPYWWAKQYRVLEQLGWVRTTDDWVERYLEHQRCLASLTEGLWAAGHAVSGVADERFLGLDPSLAVRAAENVEAAASWHPERGYLDVRTEPRAISSAQALVGELRNAVSGLTPALVEVLEAKVRPAFPRLTLTDTSPYRGDAYVAFAPAGAADDASFRIWITADGAWVGAMLAEPPEDVPSGLEVFGIETDPGTARTRFGSTPADGRILVGKRFDLEEALDRPAFADDVIAVAADLVELLHTAWGAASEPEARPSAPSHDSIAALVDRWRAETDFPSPGERA